MPQFYISSKTSNQPLVQRVGQILTDKGWKWSFNWTQEKAFPKPYQYGKTDINHFLEQCMQGIRNADLFIFLAQDSDKARGSFIELGVALSTPAEIWIIGDEDPSIFSALKRVHHAADIEEFLSLINQGE